MAGIYAKGITKLTKVGYILRGYENLDQKLNKLGAKITREDEAEEQWIMK